MKNETIKKGDRVKIVKGNRYRGEFGTVTRKVVTRYAAPFVIVRVEASSDLPGIEVSAGFELKAVRKVG